MALFDLRSYSSFAAWQHSSKLGLALGFNTFKFSPFMQIDKEYSAYQYSDYRIADGDVLAHGRNAFVFVVAHKLYLSNSSPSKMAGCLYLTPHHYDVRLVCF